MRPIVAEIVDFDAVWKTIVGSIIAACGLTVIFSVTLRGWVSAGEARRDRRSVAAVGWMAVAVIGALVLVAGIVLGLIVIASDN